MPDDTPVQPDAAAAAAAAPAPDAGAAAVAAAPEGQGQGAAPSGLYSLDTIPENIRPQVEPIFKEWEGNVTREFQKRAEAVQAWEPYDQLGLREYAPDDIGKLIEFAQLVSDDDAFKTWVQEQATGLGLLEAQAAAGAEEPGADAAAQGAGQEMLTAEAVQQQIQQALEADRQAREQSQAQADQLEQVASSIRSTLDGLKEAHPDLDEDLVLAIAGTVDHDDPVECVKQGFARLQGALGQAEKAAFKSALDAPETPETGGRADATAEKPTSFLDAGARAREQFRISQRT